MMATPEPEPKKTATWYVPALAKGRKSAKFTLCLLSLSLSLPPSLHPNPPHSLSLPLSPSPSLSPSVSLSNQALQQGLATPFCWLMNISNVSACVFASLGVNSFCALQHHFHPRHQQAKCCEYSTLLQSCWDCCSVSSTGPHSMWWMWIVQNDIRLQRLYQRRTVTTFRKCAENSNLLM